MQTASTFLFGIGITRPLRTLQKQPITIDQQTQTTITTNEMVTTTTSNQYQIPPTLTNITTKNATITITTNQQQPLPTFTTEKAAPVTTVNQQQLPSTTADNYLSPPLTNTADYHHIVHGCRHYHQRETVTMNIIKQHQPSSVRKLQKGHSIPFSCRTIMTGFW